MIREKCTNSRCVARPIAINQNNQQLKQKRYYDKIMPANESFDKVKVI